MSKRDRALRCEGYDYARWRVRKYLLHRAVSAKSAAEARRLEGLAEYVGVMLADYAGEGVDMDAISRRSEGK
jgi:hypothetical protein